MGGTKALSTYIASPCGHPAPSALADCPLILRTTPRHLTVPPSSVCPALWRHKFPRLVLFPHRKQNKRPQGCGRLSQAGGGNTQNMTHSNTKPPGTISMPALRPSNDHLHASRPPSPRPGTLLPRTPTAPRGPSSTVQPIKVRPPPEAPHASPGSGRAGTLSTVRTRPLGLWVPAWSSARWFPPGRREGGAAGDWCKYVWWRGVARYGLGEALLLQGDLLQHIFFGFLNRLKLIRVRINMLCSGDTTKWRRLPCLWHGPRTCLSWLWA